MDKAELEFLSICISYAEKFGKKLGNLKPYDIRCKFIRSLNDDPVASSQAYVNCKVGGMNDLDALIVSKLVTDASEVAKNNKNAFENGLLKIQIEEKAKKVCLEKQPYKHLHLKKVKITLIITVNNLIK